MGLLLTKTAKNRLHSKFLCVTIPPVMKPLFFLLSALFVGQPLLAAESAPVAAVEKQVMSFNEQADAVFHAMTVAPSYIVLEPLLDSPDELLLQIFRESMEEIRPCCEMLRSLPLAQVKELFMLAEAALWQGDWVYSMYLSELGAEHDEPMMAGWENMAYTAALLRQVESGERAVSPEVSAVVQELVEMVGGDKTLSCINEWRDEQLAQDYKTALQFYKELCTAVSVQDEATSLKLIEEQVAVMDYFVKKGQGEIWRVNKIALSFHAALIEARGRVAVPYHDPVLPKELRTEKRMKALQPFYDTFPALREMLES